MVTVDLEYIPSFTWYISNVRKCRRKYCCFTNAKVSVTLPIVLYCYCIIVWNGIISNFELGVNDDFS